MTDLVDLDSGSSDPAPCTLHLPPHLQPQTADPMASSQLLTPRGAVQLFSGRNSTRNIDSIILETTLKEYPILT